MAFSRPLALVLVALATACGASSRPPPRSGAVKGDGTDGLPLPAAVCAPAASPADVSSPSAVVGTGTVASCTEAAFEAAVAAGGVVAFDCGPDPVVLYVTTEKRVTRDTVIDGGGRVAISGGGATRILGIHSTFDRPGPLLTVQNLTLRDGLATGTAVPLGTDVDGGGGAIFHLGGSVVAVNSRFIGNQGAPWGPDVAGGAIFGIGVGSTVVSGCAFRGNRASNGGALGSLHTAVTVANATFESNEATGRGANSVDGAGQQVGHGGNGGALSMDGEWRTLSLCGATFRGNAAGAIGGAVFRTSYHGEPTVIDRSAFDGNAVADAAPSLAGGAYLQGTQATVTASTVSRNTANGASGLWFGDMAPGTSRADLLNVTIAGNYVRERADFTRMGLAGGLWTADVPGTVQSTTIAGNRAQFGAGIVGLAGLTLADTIVSNTALNPYVNANCHDFGGVPAAGSGVLQWTAAGQDAPCVPGATVADPLLGPLGDSGGPTETMLPGPSSPALGQGLACPATDQRGSTRTANGCDLGAVEVP